MESVSVEKIATIAAYRYSRSSGPGGQHRDHAATRVQARVQVDQLDLTDEETERVHAALGETIVASSQIHREQSRNKTAALERISEKIVAALQIDAERVPTKVPKRAKEKKKVLKQHRSATKQARKSVSLED